MESRTCTGTVQQQQEQIISQHKDLISISLIYHRWRCFRQQMNVVIGCTEVAHGSRGQ